jgi:hypothetical protein
MTEVNSQKTPAINRNFISFRWPESYGVFMKFGFDRDLRRESAGIHVLGEDSGEPC